MSLLNGVSSYLKCKDYPLLTTPYISCESSLRQAVMFSLRYQSSKACLYSIHVCHMFLRHVSNIRTWLMYCMTKKIVNSLFTTQHWNLNVSHKKLSHADIITLKNRYLIFFDICLFSHCHSLVIVQKQYHNKPPSTDNDWKLQETQMSVNQPLICIKNWVCNHLCKIICADKMNKIPQPTTPHP